MMKSKKANFSPPLENLEVNKRVKKDENQSPNWLELPEAITMEILQRVGVRYIFEVVQFVCVSWHNICKEPYMWRSIILHDKIYYRSRMHMEMLCRHAVDRSCGQLDHITISWFGTDDLLEYIADQSPQLRSLHLRYCSVLRNNRVQVAKMLPNLEELKLAMSQIPKEAIESFGKNCPQLKSLIYFTFHFESDTELAPLLAIAQTMPGLRHLWLSDGAVTNDVLQAILDWCPHLTSLVIYRCSNVKLEGDFGRSLALRVKNLEYIRKR